ncbi:DsbA family oxidoreductase [Timonella senegalensis]|uniref:DsbA family oxidoreductase n=1 Tax=Timonella senegalensis TaxID=1465825 RepID=UPI0028A79937|nr:DsbA family oxidoreductase [Timonella senegalensis]
MSSPLKVDIWSDIACPWCYIGKRKFEEGLSQFAGRDDVEVEYHSFELAPDTPVDFEGSEIDFLAKHKGMPKAQVEQMLDHVTGIAAEVGLEYRFDQLKHTKTLQAHQLLHFAKSQGKQREMKERLLKAYFTEGKHVGKNDTLVELAGEIGLDKDATRAALESGEFASDVQADLNMAREYGINGVPFFVFNNKYGVSGAQAPETFTQVLDQVAGELEAESVK